MKGATGLFLRDAPSTSEKLKVKMVASDKNIEFLPDMVYFEKAGRSSVELRTADLGRDQYSMTGRGYTVSLIYTVNGG